VSDIIKKPVSRRTVAKGGIASILAAGAMPTIFTSASTAQATGYCNAPTGSSVTLGFNVPQSGPYADEGADELRAYKLAVKHLNGEGDGGMMNTFKPSALKGNGILGKKVAFVTGDTQTKSDAARASAKRMIEKDKAVMITGGSSSGVAVAVQSLCQEAGIIFMAGLTHSNDTTGKDKRANGFRHFFNTHMSGAALGPVLEKEYGKERVAYHLTADYNWGWSQQRSMKEFTENIGWKTQTTVNTPVGAGDFSQYITPVLNSGADVLILNHYGKDMVNSLTQAVQFGLRDKQVNGKNFEIVVPLFSRLMAQGAGESIKGILGSTNWNWSLQDEGSKAFVKSFGAEYGAPLLNTAHRHQWLLIPVMCKRCFMPMLPKWREHSLPTASSSRWKASNLMAWATDRQSIALKITSALKMFLWCVVMRNRLHSLTFWKWWKSPRVRKSNSTPRSWVASWDRLTPNPARLST